MSARPAVGSLMSTWFSGRDDGMSTVISVEPYRGRYTQWFTWTVRLTALNTRRGWMEMAL